MAGVIGAASLISGRHQSVCAMGLLSNMFKQHRLDSFPLEITVVATLLFLNDDRQNLHFLITINNNLIGRKKSSWSCKHNLQNYCIMNVLHSANYEFITLTFSELRK